ncbi:MAG: serine hydrolase domain-containing protein [bacterium]
MKRGIFAFIFTTLFAAAAVFCFGCGGAGDGSPTSPVLQALLDDAVKATAMPAAVICITEANGRSWAQASGRSDLNSIVPAAADDLFRIASNSKTFTATAVLLLRDDGLLGLDDPIANYVHDLGIPHDDVITIRMLLNHTSGLADHENDTPWLNEQLMADRFHEFEPQELIAVALAVAPDLLFAPGTGFHYSNTGYVVLSVIANRVSGMSFKDFVRARIIEPFGLAHTYILPGAEMPATPYAHGYSYSNGGTTVTDFTVMNESWDVGAGGMISTVCDLAAFMRLLFGGQILSADSLSQMETFSTQARYGLGCNYTDGLGWGHDGSTYGYNSIMSYEPADGVAYAAFVNGTTDDGQRLFAIFDTLKEIARTFKEDLGY